MHPLLTANCSTQHMHKILTFHDMLVECSQVALRKDQRRMFVAKTKKTTKGIRHVGYVRRENSPADNVWNLKKRAKNGFMTRNLAI